jgi:hypothetical protein
MNIPSLADVFAVFFAARPEPGPEHVTGHMRPCDLSMLDAEAGPEDKPVPYTLTPQAEAVLDAAGPELEAEP